MADTHIRTNMARISGAARNNAANVPEASSEARLSCCLTLFSFVGQTGFGMLTGSGDAQAFA
jgi:hypothetical protein